MPVTRSEVQEVLRMLRSARLSNAPGSVATHPATPEEQASREAALDEAHRMVTIWEISFQDWTAAQLHAAAIAYLNSPDPSHRFWPTPGALRAAMPPPPGALGLTPEEVWPVALSLLMSVGGGEEAGFYGADGGWTRRHRIGRWKHQMIKRFDLATMEQTLSALGGVEGYDQIASGTTSEHMSHRARFCNAWAGARERQKGDETWEQLSTALTGPRIAPRPSRPPRLTVVPEVPADEAGAEARAEARVEADRPARPTVLRGDQGWDQRPESLEHRPGRGSP